MADFDRQTLERLADYDFSDRNEAAIREEWVYPLLQLLGYGGSLDRVEFEDSLNLARPVRKLGCSRYRVDYRPTVLRRNLWILEAKPPAEGEDWQEHIAQAWSYATHPEVDVPLAAIADGSRIAVYDMSVVEFDQPLVDVTSAELVERFEEIRDVLGARHVSELVRRRQLRHLGTALTAALDFEVLDATIRDVDDIVARARERVAENRRLVIADQSDREARLTARIDRASGIWGLAQEFNVPVGFSRRDLDRATAVIEASPVDRRGAELADFRRATSTSRDDRRSWGNRAYELATALRVRGHKGCADAERLAREGLRNALLGFPDNETARLAYSVDRVLPVAVMRALASPNGVNFGAIEEHLRRTTEVETLLRQPMDRHRLALQAGLLYCRLIWTNITPWDAATLTAVGDALEELAATVEYDCDLLGGFILDVPLTDDYWRTWDPFGNYAVIFAARYEAGDVLGEEERQEVRRFVDAPGMAGPAARLLLGEPRDDDPPPDHI